MRLKGISPKMFVTNIFKQFNINITIMKRGIIILISAIILVGIIALYATLYYSPRCPDIKCWDERLKACSRSTYINEPVDVTWKYSILGAKGESCEVKVKLIEIKRGLKETEFMKGKEMICLVPLGFKIPPESDINKCSGPLKEEMQVLIIKKLHEYILQNIGELNKEVTGIGALNEGVTGTGNVTSTNTTTTNTTTNSTNSSG